MFKTYLNDTLFSPKPKNMKPFNQFSRLLSSLILLSLFILGACQKETSQFGTDEQQQMEASKASSEAEGEASNIFSGIFDDVSGANDEVGLAGTGVFWGRTDTLSPTARCFTVTIIRLNPPNPFPVKIIIDFGNTGCLGPDGHIRRGKIITTYTNRLIHPDAMATTTFENFFVDSTRVEGTVKIKNTSPLQSIPPIRRFTIDVIDGKLTRPNGNFIEWDSHRTITQVEGLITLDPRDDVFRIEGAAEGRVRRGPLLVIWQSTITEPLIRRFSCRWIVRGRIRTIRANLTTNSQWVGVLDFGAGHCDNQATLTINGTTHIITLP
jgi:hypothetical protein